MTEAENTVAEIQKLIAHCNEHGAVSCLSCAEYPRCGVDFNSLLADVLAKFRASISSATAEKDAEIERLRKEFQRILDLNVECDPKKKDRNYIVNRKLAIFNYDVCKIATEALKGGE